MGVDLGIDDGQDGGPRWVRVMVGSSVVQMGEVSRAGVNPSMEQALAAGGVEAHDIVRKIRPATAGD